MMFAGPLAAQSVGSADPVYIGEKVQEKRVFAHPDLADVERAGKAIWDPSSKAWYAAANGTLVRISEDGRLIVVADGVQGHDIDVRLAAGVAVSREPDDRILLHDAGASRGPAHVLMEGPSFFNPRLSPEGKSVLVHESRATGSRIWLVAVESGEARVLCEGVSAAWHSDGERVLFARIDHDSRRILGGVLAEIELATGIERVLKTPDGVAPVEPASSPDGSQIAFVDAFTDRILTMPYPKSRRGVDDAR